VFAAVNLLIQKGEIAKGLAVPSYAFEAKIDTAVVAILVVGIPNWVIPKGLFKDVDEAMFPTGEHQ
jgi:hypothetical protein